MQTNQAMKPAPVPPSSPSHRLMKSHRFALDDSLRDDYLSKRFRLYQTLQTDCTATQQSSANGGSSKASAKDSDMVGEESSAFWCGASSVERDMTNCAEFGAVVVAASNVLDDRVGHIKGALKADQCIKFVGLIAIHAHNLSLRSLALAMLEATHELDQEDVPIRVPFIQNDEAKDDSDTIDKTASEGNDDSKPSAKLEGGDDDDDDDMELPYWRLRAFLRAGGLNVLSQWFVEASTPAVAPRKSPGSVPTRVPSSTNALLLPLIELLKEMPLDKDAIKESKINRRIRKLMKTLQPAAVPDDHEADELEAVTKARLKLISGEATTPRQLYDALQSLKDTWEAEVKRQALKEFPPAPSDNPMESLLNQIRSNAQKISDYEDGKVEDKPSFWVIPSDDNSSTTNSSASNKRRQTTAERAKQERQKERAAVLRENLQEAAKARKATLQRLRQIEHQQRAAAAAAAASKSSRLRRVAWKDGFEAASRQRNRDVLEEVFVFDKDLDWQGTEEGTSDGMEIVEVHDDDSGEDDLFNDDD